VSTEGTSKINFIKYNLLNALILNIIIKKQQTEVRWLSTGKVLTTNPEINLSVVEKQSNLAGVFSENSWIKKAGIFSRRFLDN
jgi:hypothetical protein